MPVLHQQIYASSTLISTTITNRGKRLPTEAEWEMAAGGGIKNNESCTRIFPWGNEFHPNNTHRMNVWQGTFPTFNSEEDGFFFTSPVFAFEAQNELGLRDMVGNVWEWVSDG